MIMINYDPDTRVVLSGGEVNPRYALQQLPDGAAYVDSLPEGDLSGYQYINGAFVPIKQEDDYAADQD